jgi:hypothetical protein
VENYVGKYPLSIASTNTAFTTTMEQNLKNLFLQNEEKDVSIRELEEQHRHANKDDGTLREFKGCAEKVRTKIEDTITYMYAHLHVFQQLGAGIMYQQNDLRTKNVHINTIQEGLNDMKMCIVENPDAPSELPHASEGERRIDYASLDTKENTKLSWKMIGRRSQHPRGCL